MAAKQKYMRLLPGRLVGQTVEEGANRQTGYILTLQTREQHIRRERATSNICTDQTLLAVGATIFLATLGKQGLRELGELCLQKAHYAFRQITALPGYQAVFTSPFFDEFVIRVPIALAKLQALLARSNIIGGYALDASYSGMDNCMLFCVTETRTRNEIDRLVAVLEEAVSDHPGEAHAVPTNGSRSHAEHAAGSL